VKVIAPDIHDDLASVQGKVTRRRERHRVQQQKQKPLAAPRQNAKPQAADT
jgi:hypothetical protein